MNTSPGPTPRESRPGAAIVVFGDFADPLSFLASQRVEQIASLGLHDIEWLAIESRRGLPMHGRPLDADTAEAVRRLSMAGEAVPTAGLLVPNSGAATAAYAESFTDGLPDPMRRALFDALWVQGRNIADTEILRSVAFSVFNPQPPAADLQRRSQANQPLVPLGDPDPFAVTRRLGFLVSMDGGPLTGAGHRRVQDWRRLWERHGSPHVPLLLTDAGEAVSGEHALAWLADQTAARSHRQAGRQRSPSRQPIEPRGPLPVCH